MILDAAYLVELEHRCLGLCRISSGLHAFDTKLNTVMQSCKASMQVYQDLLLVMQDLVGIALNYAAC